MAKRIIFQTTEEVKRASNALKDFHIEHVVVVYPAKKDKDGKQFIVVMNKNLNDAVIAIKTAKISFVKIHGMRHYEMTALNHTHYQPSFECKCRYCSKTFKSPIKEAVWCSKKCKHDFRHDFRIAKKQTKAT